MLFIIPQPLAAPAAAGPFPGANRFDAPDAPSTVGGRFGAMPDGPAGAAPAGDPSAPTAPAEPEILHIPCPNGHELDTPVEMLEQEVLCPKCNVQFRLRRKDSVEFKKKKEQDEKIHLEKMGNAWLNWAIAAVVLVVVGLLGLIVLRAMNQ